MPKRKAAVKGSGAADEPNVVLPLATSINERGITGYTHSVTNSQDQRKLNCQYALAKNPLTGKGTLVLEKRPGVTADVAQTAGTSTQSNFLIIRSPGGTFPWVANKLVNDIRVSSLTTNTILFASANVTPVYIDMTLVSGVETVLLQTKAPGFGGAQRAFYSNAIAVWTEITDVDFTTLLHRGKIEPMDGYASIMDSQNRIFSSDVNSLAAWTATSFITKQIVQDVPIGLAKLNNQLCAFGEQTMEPFYNAGNTIGSPFSPVKHLAQRVGMVAPLGTSTQGGGHYYCVIGRNMFFVGREAGGQNSCGLYAWNGSVMEKVSSGYIDKILSEAYTTGDFTTTNGFSSVNSVGIHGRSAVAISLALPNDTTQRWLMFFPEWKEWFEWTSTVFCPINEGEYFLSCLTSNKEKLYKFPSTDNWQDAGTSYQWFSQFKLPTSGSARRFMPMYGVDADTDTSANDLTVEISTNDSATFSTLGTIDQTQDRKVLFRGGSFRHAHIRLGNTNARPSRISNFLARIE
jgi:hypothetical protein